MIDEMNPDSKVLINEKDKNMNNLMYKILDNPDDNYKPPKKKIAFLERIKEKIKQNILERQKELKAEQEKKEQMDLKIEESLKSRKYTYDNTGKPSEMISIEEKNSNNDISSSNNFVRIPLKQKRSTFIKGLQKIIIQKKNSIFSDISKSFKSENKIDLEEKFPKKKLDNNIFTGFCYSIVESFEIKDFNMKRLQSLDFNDLKIKLFECKNEYKKLNKEQRKNYVNDILEIGSKFKSNSDEKLNEFKEKGKPHLLFKLANNCINTQKIKIDCDFTEENIEIAIRCMLNEWEYPPFDFYLKLANKDENEKNFNEGDVKNNGSESDRNVLHISEASLINTGNSHKELKDSPKINNNDIQINEFSIRKYSLSRKKSSLFRGGFINNLQARKNLTFINIFEELNYMTTNEHLKDIYMELINNNMHKYEQEKEIIRKKINGKWIDFQDLLKNFNYLILIYKNNYLETRKNFDLNWYNYINDIYNLDRENRVYLISFKEEAIDKMNAEILNLQNQFIIQQQEIVSKNAGANNKNNSLQSNRKSLIQTNSNQKDSDLKNINNIVLHEENKIKEISPSNYDSLNSNRSLIIEFSPNNGSFIDIIQEFNFYIVLDIYEIQGNNSSIINNNIPAISKTINNNLSVRDSINTTYNSPRNIEKETNNVKILFENVILSGFYCVFNQDVFEKEKEYIILVKSSFTPFGYNLKFLTNKAVIDKIPYDKYLNLYGELKFFNSYKIPIPNLQAENQVLIGKFLLRFLNSNFLKDNKSIKIKFSSIVSEDYYLFQFFELFMQVNSGEDNYNNKNNSKTKTSETFNGKKIIFGEIIEIPLKGLKFEDEIFVKIN